MNKLVHKQKGISLLELMVSLSIGVLLLLALGSVYVTSSKTNRIREANEQLDETARQVFDRLQYDLNLAGYVDIFDGMQGNPNVLASQVANLSDPVVQRMYGRIVDSAVAPQTPMQIAYGNAVQGLTGTNNSLTITYQVAPRNAASGMATLPAANDADNADSGWGMDCLSQQPNDPTLVINVYSFANQTFSCNGEPIVGGVALTDSSINEMTFRYFVTPDANNVVGANADLYNSQSGLYSNAILDANDVINNTTLQWTGVTAVEVCMVVAGAPLNGQLAELATVQPQVPTCARNAAGIFNANQNRNANDNRLYRRYIKVLSIPNALYFTQ